MFQVRKPVLSRKGITVANNPHDEGYKEGYKDGAKGEYGKGGGKNPYSSLSDAMSWDEGYSKGHIDGTHGHKKSVR